MQRRQLDERQKQLRGRGFSWALGILALLLIIVVSGDIFLGHSLFASETLLIAVPLLLVCGPLIMYVIAVDAYFSMQEHGLLPVLSAVFLSLIHI